MTWAEKSRLRPFSASEKVVILVVILLYLGVIWLFIYIAFNPEFVRHYRTHIVIGCIILLPIASFRDIKRAYIFISSRTPNSLADRRLRETRDHEIRVIKANQDASAWVFRIDKLKLDHEERKLGISQPHQVRMEQEKTLKEMLTLQRELAAKADKTDFEKELDSVVSSAVTLYRSLSSIPLIYDVHGNVDDVAMNRMYQGLTDHGWQLLNTTVAKSKKDLAG